MFESFANSERYKTIEVDEECVTKFESFANSERYKTGGPAFSHSAGLRALLIQKVLQCICEFSDN